MGVFIHGWPRTTSRHWTSVVVTPPTIEPVTLAEVKARARITANDEDQLLVRYVKAARNQVEQDTGLALLTQTRDVFFDGLPWDYTPIRLPWPPLQSVTFVKSTDTAGSVNTLAASNYTVDASSFPGRLALSDAGIWPTDLRLLQPWTVRIVVGWTSVALVPPVLIEAVGLLATHFATNGRDLVNAGTPNLLVPQTYDDKIATYRLVSVA